MKFEKFMEQVVGRVQEVVGADTDVQMKKIRKNNNVFLHGLLMSQKKSNAVLTIYLDGYYEMLKDGSMNLDHIVQSILKEYIDKKPHGKVDMDFFMNYENVKRRIIYHLVNREKNKELLADIPHEEFLDLAICFYYNYESPEIGDGVILIHNSHLDMWTVSCQELRRLADFNTPKLMPAELCSMNEAIATLGEGDLEDTSLEDTSKFLYVLSNKKHCMGAAAILYPGILREIARRLGGNFYILPSSIHETILMKDNGRCSSEKLHEIIADINRSQLREEEVLSDYAYFYDAATGKVKES